MLSAEVVLRKFCHPHSAYRLIRYSVCTCVFVKVLQNSSPEVLKISTDIIFLYNHTHFGDGKSEVQYVGTVSQ